MTDYFKTINNLPIDPSDERFFYGIDFGPIIDDEGSIENPYFDIDANGTSLGLEINNLTVSGTKVVFRPTISAEKRSDEQFNGDGVKFLVTLTVENALGRTLQRSGYLWYSQR